MTFSKKRAFILSVILFFLFLFILIFWVSLAVSERTYGIRRHFYYSVNDSDGMPISDVAVDVRWKWKPEGDVRQSPPYTESQNGAYRTVFRMFVFRSGIRSLIVREPYSIIFTISKDDFKTQTREFLVTELDERYLIERGDGFADYHLEDFVLAKTGT